MDDNGDTLRPSQRGLENLQRGRQLDISQALDGITLYDPVKAPHGLISSPSGADNELMPEVLDKCARRFGKAYQLEDGTPAASGCSGLTVLTIQLWVMGL